MILIIIQNKEIVIIILYFKINITTEISLFLLVKISHEKYILSFKGDNNVNLFMFVI